MQETLFNYPNLDVRAGGVFDLVLDPTAASTGPIGPTFAVRGVRLGNKLLFLLDTWVNHMASQIMGILSSVNRLLSAQGPSYPGRFTSVE